MLGSCLGEECAQEKGSRTEVTPNPWAGCGQTEKGSQQRQEREEDGWMRVARERHQFLSSSVRPSGRSCSNLPFTGVHLQGPLLLPTEKPAHIPWTGH